MTLMDRHTPKTLDDIKLDDKILDPIIAWANLWLNRLPDPSKPAMLLYGYPGIGKTLISRCLALDCGWNLIELNASDVRTREQLNHFSVRSSDIFGRDNIVLFDEIDSTDKDGEAVIRRIIMQCKFPVILTANDLMKVPKSLKDVCEIVQVYRPSVNSLKSYIQDVIKKERMIVSEEVLAAAAASQDYRMAFNIVENGVVLHKKQRGATLVELTMNLMNNNLVQLDELRSVLWYIEENAGRFYDIVELDKLLDILSRVDKYKRRGQEGFAIQLIKEIPKATIMVDEVKYPAYFEKEREKKRKKKAEI